MAGVRNQMVQKHSELSGLEVMGEKCSDITLSGMPDNLFPTNHLIQSGFTVYRYRNNDQGCEKKT